MPEALVTLRAVAKTWAGAPCFEGLDLVVHEGARLALVGANGSGKSTLLALVAGTVAPDEGERHVRRDLVAAVVAQADSQPSSCGAREVLEQALANRGLADHERAARVSRLLGELAWPDPEQDVATLSGGWRKRLALARGLVGEPDLLLLDEPTNHLDLDGVLWLEATLDRYPGTVVVVSHDRWFLDRVANRVVEIGRLFPGGAFAATGGWSDFRRAREAFVAQERERQASLANKMRREEAWLARRPKARTTKSVSRIRAAEELRQELGDVGRRLASERQAGIDFSATGRRANELVVAEAITKAWAGVPCFSGLDLALGPGDRLGLVGGNGSGKTTLLRVLSGSLAADQGCVRHAHGLRAVVFSQDRGRLEPSQTLHQHLCPVGGDAVVFRDAQLHVRAYANRFLFAPQQLDQPVASLSGGEQARLLIALMMLEPADLLVLDEPTNDLDILSLEILEERLLDFPGAVILVSHDRFLVDRVCTRLIALDGVGTAYANYGQWQAVYQADGRSQPESVRKPTASAVVSGAPLSWAEQKELRNLTGRIEQAERLLERRAEALADPAVVTDPVRLQAAMEAQAEAQAEVDRLYERWGELAG